MLFASDLYARCHGKENGGVDECHWCGAKCERLIPHDDHPLDIGVKRQATRRPGNAYVCWGCHLYRRTRITVNFIDGGYQDRQCPKDHGWLIRPGLARAVRPESYADLYGILLSPPFEFVLALLDGPGPNLLQLMIANQNSKIKADTPLAYTVNGVRHEYTVYELKEAARDGPEGKMPGVQALFRLLGKPPRVPPREEPSKRRGRPAALEDGRVTKSLLAASGMTLTAAIA